MDDYPRVAIDIGSSAVRVLVGTSEPDRLILSGCGEARHDGARKGTISSLEQIVGALNLAIEEAEAMSSVPIEHVYTALGGGTVYGMPATAQVRILNREEKVLQSDISAVLSRCTEMELPSGIRPLGVVPGQYILDGRPGLTNPLGMIGRDLEARAFVFHTDTGHADLMAHAINQASVAVFAMTHEALAASHGVLTADEKDLGCLLIDIGHATSEWMVWRENMVMATGTHPVGGRHFSTDLATILKTTAEGAEKIKRIVPATPNTEGLKQLGIDVPEIGTGGMKLIDGFSASQILFERANELMTEIATEICRLDLEKNLGGGIILTGGGALLGGLPLVAERVFAQQTRIGEPMDIAGESEPVSSPSWAVACGLLRWAALHEEDQSRRAQKKTGLKDRLKRVFNGVFD